MVTVLERGSAKSVTRISCSRCHSKLEVGDAEWRDGGYGSERFVSCPVCAAHLIKPGTEYTGDF
jgi:NAD-dependent SIR2 family protein deacetylase